MKKILIIILIIFIALLAGILIVAVFFTGDNKEKKEAGDTATYNCESDIYNCGDFETQADAQKVLDYCGPADIHRLDADGNGVACEGLG